MSNNAYILIFVSNTFMFQHVGILRFGYFAKLTGCDDSVMCEKQILQVNCQNARDKSLNDC